MSPVAYNFRKGVDLPSWQWLSFFLAGASNPGTASAYDGKRYMYWVVQFGTTATTASTTQLWRYDCWLDGWQYLATTTSGNQGIDIEYDSVRNVLYIMHGAALTSWQVFNLNLTAVTIANTSCPAFSLTTMPLVLPVASNPGASFTMPDDTSVPAVIDTGTADSTGNTTTIVKATDATGTFGQGMIGLQVNVLTGAQTGQKRTILSVTDKNTLVLGLALPLALATGDTFQIELVNDVATAATTLALTDASSNWIVNQYSNNDVIITSGAANGQRRRIASNTATVLTLAAAVTGNARTGPFSVTPDATSTYRIVPSSDCLYYQPGNATTALYKIDLVQTTGAAWSGLLAASPAAIGPGSNTFFPGAYAPYYILAFRGAATAVIYLYNIGTNVWSTPAVWAASETFTNGDSVCMVTGRRKLFIAKESSQRTYLMDLLTGILEPGPPMPYATPTAYDGKRARFVKTLDGVEYIYLLRPGGQEFFRVPLEWL